MRENRCLVIGTSLHGMDALRLLFTNLKLQFPSVIVQHLSPDSESYLSKYLSDFSEMRFKEADDKERLLKENVYISPPNYHLMISPGGILALSVDERVNYARPSVDVLFETAAYVYRENLIGLIMTGTGHDGSKGLKLIQDYGGTTIVQDPQEAAAPDMPLAAMQCLEPDYVLKIADIKNLLTRWSGEENAK